MKFDLPPPSDTHSSLQEKTSPEHNTPTRPLLATDYKHGLGFWWAQTKCQVPCMSATCAPRCPHPHPHPQPRTGAMLSLGPSPERGRAEREEAPLTMLWFGLQAFLMYTLQPGNVVLITHPNTGGRLGGSPPPPPPGGRAPFTGLSLVDTLTRAEIVAGPCYPSTPYPTPPHPPPPPISTSTVMITL